VRGDQFEQKDRRWVFGLVPTYDWNLDLFERTFDNTVGLQVRSDLIHNGLFNTVERDRVSVTREDDITETSVGVFFDTKTAWTDWFRTDAGVRVDFFDFDVDSNIPDNSGSKAAVIASPKLSLVFGPWYETELYLNGGYDFHSNDARGVVGRIDPKTGEAIAQADPLVRSKGAEVGLRTAILPGLQSSVSLWILDIDSELLFIGDAGNTEASRPSQRYGIEFANFYSPLPWLTLDADVSISRARFRCDDPAGDFIPGSIETVVAAGITVDDFHDFFGSLRVRYFGPRALIEDDSVRSDAATLVNLQAGYRITDRWSVALDIFNVFDSDVSDIDYFYASRLSGEPEDGIDDIHTHPAEPRSFRGVVTYEFGAD
jgi:outer membrane receptor protein involved in Fe transport